MKRYGFEMASNPGRGCIFLAEKGIPLIGGNIESIADINLLCSVDFATALLAPDPALARRYG